MFTVQAVKGLKLECYSLSCIHAAAHARENGNGYQREDTQSDTRVALANANAQRKISVL